MSKAGPDEHRTRFRRPLGVAVMAYKAILGLSEIAVGVLLAIPSFDPQATFARLSAEERREDPGDRLVALISRHLPALLHHRRMVAVGLILFGLAKLVAAAAMWKARNGAATCWPRASRCCSRWICARPCRSHRWAGPAGRGKHDRPGCPGPARPGMVTWSATLGWAQPPLGFAPPLR